MYQTKRLLTVNTFDANMSGLFTAEALHFVLFLLEEQLSFYKHTERYSNTEPRRSLCISEQSDRQGASVPSRDRYNPFRTDCSRPVKGNKLRDSFVCGE
jgi:hypothetical protein